MLLKAIRQRNTNELDRAKRLSKHMQSVKTHIRNIHKKRLDQLLASNELERLPVSADGNCFFSAVIQCMANSDPLDVNTFRESVCDLMIENIEKYSKFLSVESE